MSHVAVVDVVVKDLDALAKACQKLGLELRIGQKTFNWYGKWVGDYNGNNAAFNHGIKPEDYGKCDHAISIPGKPDAYEIGLVDDGAGGFKLVYDFWNGGYGIEKLAGKDCSKVVESYTEEVTKNECKAIAETEGYFYSENYDEATGEMVIELTSY
jgi:hypothetical protein